VPGVGVNRIIVGVTTRGWVIVIVEVMNIIARVPAEAIIVIRIIVLITRRGTSWRPQALLIQDAGENLIPQASPHTGVCNSGQQRLGDENGLLRTNKTRVPAPCLNKEFTVVLCRSITNTADFHLAAAGPQTQLGHGDVPSMRR